MSKTLDPRMPVRAHHILRVRAIWVIPLVLASVVVGIMTALYMWSVVDPVSHLSGLPVAVVNQDRGATVGSQRLNIGRQVESGLLTSLSGPLRLDVLSLPQAERAMSSDDSYATVVIPANFTSALLNISASQKTVRSAVPRVAILTNQRAGTLGTELATGFLQPALAVASHQVGRHLSTLVPPASQTDATEVLLSNPITVTTAQYRPLPPNSALGLSAFYVALLTIMCGFLGATIVNSVVDSGLGYATTEFGHRWRQRQPLPINRWQTLLTKWALIVVLTAVLTALMLGVAVGVGMDAPNLALLWLFTWLCAASVGVGTIVLFAVVGTYGQLIALLLFVYAGLASAGGTVPVEALPGFLRTLSSVEPLRQTLEGTRSILYFGAQADAGLTRGILAASLGLLLWLIMGIAVVRWYDRKRFYRLQPELLAHIGAAVQDYKAGQTPASEASSDGEPHPAAVTVTEPPLTAEHNGTTASGS